MLEVIEGVLFERGNIFKKYVETLYKLRKSFKKEDPKNLICKLLLNSLYGKFGMNPHLHDWTLYDKTLDNVIKALNTKNSSDKGVILDSIELGNKLLICQPSLKNNWTRLAMSKEEAIEFMAKYYNEDKEILAQDLAWSDSLRTHFKKLTSVAEPSSTFKHFFTYQYGRNSLC